MLYDTTNAACRHHAVHGHGPRRRRCADCGTTWTVRAKRRGRKPRKHRTAIVRRTFTHQQTVVARAAATRIDADTWRKHHAATLRILLARAWPHRPPHGNLILILDALWHTIDGEEWTTYLLGLRAIDGEEIVFLRPILRPGHESQEQWREAVGTIPKNTRTRIRAIIADSFAGVGTLAGEERWVLQRCHFHLLGKLATLCGNRKRRIVWWRERQRMQVLIRRVLCDTDERRVRRACHELRYLADDGRCPVRIRRIIRSTLRWRHDFRAWYEHPALRLPATTNAVENINSRIRSLLHRHRGLRTADALERWIVAYVWFHPRMKCRPKNLQK